VPHRRKHDLRWRLLPPVKLRGTLIWGLRLSVAEVRFAIGAFGVQPQRGDSNESGRPEWEP